MASARDWYVFFEKAGVQEESIVDLTEVSGPRHVRYLDLIRSNDHDEPLPDAVVESSGAPLVYVVSLHTLGSAPGDQQALKQLVRVLACRADARYLAVIEPGQVAVYPILIDDALRQPLFHDTEEARYAMFRGMLTGSVAQKTSSPVSRRSRKSSKAAVQWLDELLFQLLSDAAREIHAAVPALSIQQVLALVGRALFFRFLVDRGIVTQEDLPSITRRVKVISKVFGTLEALVDTCKWLDRTFNGDLLSFSEDDSHDAHHEYTALEQVLSARSTDVCWHLTNIQAKALRGQLPLGWSGIYFKHVPVDVLSQVYEDFAHEFVPALAKATSIHFTPRKLAEIVVDGAFSAVNSAPPDQARVLDPAVGGGVFLVLAFKRLVEERWRATGERPRRAEIRQILMKQLVGLDVNRDALNVTALSLYLCALELDPDPSPLSDLKFQKLIGAILHPVDIEALDPTKLPGNSKDDADLGSLSDQVVFGPLSHSFDIVIGNPPWNSFKDGRKNALNLTLRKLLTKRLQPATPPATAMVARYGSPDIAFVLAASLWAKTRGAIGFAVHGRILFQPQSFELRRYLFESLRITGIMNFAALRQDKKIWPKNDAPFALMVAVNESPGPLDSFYFVSPRHEPSLSDEGVFRIDPGAAIPVSLSDVCSEPHALKALFKGGRLGLDLLRRITGGLSLPIGQQVAKHGGEFNSGYQTGKHHNRTEDASHLLGLLDVQHDMQFTAAPGSRAGGAPDKHYSLPRIQWPRSPDVFRGPLLLLRESPKIEREIRGALYATNDVAYSESFIGLSALNKPQLAQLMDLIYVVSYSDLFLYYQLLTSPKFGVERDSSLQKDLLAFPLVREETLRDRPLRQLRKVAEDLREGTVNWIELDDLVFELHGLTPADAQLIRDTLAMELPFTDVSRDATATATAAERKAFCYSIETLLAPFCTLDQPVRVMEFPERPIDGWVFIEVGEQRHSPAPIPKGDLANLVEFADSYWSSRIAIKQGDRTIYGLLDQRRYWTRTEARTLALGWLQDRAPLASQSRPARSQVGAAPT
jgi:hypothetical protein